MLESKVSYDIVPIVIRLFMRMVFFHILDDYVLQAPTLGKLKQKSYWEENVSPEDMKTKYKNDYVVALFAHAFSWSFMISIPLMREGWTWMLTIIILINTAIHGIVDDLKANERKINLVQDQLIHLLQIAMTLGLYILEWFATK